MKTKDRKKTNAYSGQNKEQGYSLNPFIQTPYKSTTGRRNTPSSEGKKAADDRPEYDDRLKRCEHFT